MCAALPLLRAASRARNAHTRYEEYEWEEQEGDKLVVNTRTVRAVHLTDAALDAHLEFAPRKALARAQQPQRRAADRQIASARASFAATKQRFLLDEQTGAAVRLQARALVSQVKLASMSLVIDLVNKCECQ
jgi:hypothetical protein